MPLPLKWRGKKFPAEAETQMARERRGKRQWKYNQAPPQAEQRVGLGRKAALWSQLMRWKVGRASAQTRVLEILSQQSPPQVRDRACLVWVWKSSPPFLRTQARLRWLPVAHQCPRPLSYCFPAHRSSWLPLTVPCMTCPQWSYEPSQALILTMTQRKNPLLIWS